MDQGENMLLQANISTVILSTLDPMGVLTGRSTTEVGELLQDTGC